MSLHVNVNDTEIAIEPECTQRVIFSTDIPPDSSARTKDVGVTLVVIGKILADASEVGKPADSTAKLMEWSKVPAESAKAYRSVKVVVKAGGISTRQYELPYAYIEDYYEDYNNQEGSGVFTLILKQAKNKLAKVKITGGFKDE